MFAPRPTPKNSRQFRARMLHEPLRIAYIARAAPTFLSTQICGGPGGYTQDFENLTTLGEL